MIERFEIIGHDSPRPDARRIIFCDGTGGSIFDPANDLELSHWRPNHTPAEYRAGTSTEICFRFLDQPLPGDWTAAVNNHLDVDGILSVYALVHSEHALAHRRTIIEAAEMGDFWGWGSEPAQRLFQGLTRLMNGDHAGANTRAIYEVAFAQIPALVNGTHSDCAAIDESLAPLRSGVALVEEGRIARLLVDSRLAHYILPASVIREQVQRATYTPGFNEEISPLAVLWPQVRARWDRERVCLVSAEASAGWLHDLWFPGYLWADTEGLWTVPGLSYGNAMGAYTFVIDSWLSHAVEILHISEKNLGTWAFGGEHSPFHDKIQDSFPLAARFVDEQGRPAASSLLPENVAGCLREMAASFS